MEIQDPATETILRVLASNLQLNVTNGKTQNLSFFRPFFGLELHRLQTCAFFRFSISYLDSYLFCLYIFHFARINTTLRLAMKRNMTKNIINKIKINIISAK